MACLVVCAFLPIATAYHDCVQPARGRRLPPSFGGVPNPGPSSANDDQCAGGLCVVKIIPFSNTFIWLSGRLGVF